MTLFMFLSAASKTYSIYEEGAAIPAFKHAEVFLTINNKTYDAYCEHNDCQYYSTNAATPRNALNRYRKHFARKHTVH